MKRISLKETGYSNEVKAEKMNWRGWCKPEI